MKKRAEEKAVVLLSGGLDSATALAVARSRSFQCHTLSVHYGQHAWRELVAAAAVSRSLGAVRHQEIAIDLKSIGGSVLLEHRQVPGPDEASRRFGIPETYVPARNTVLLSLALGWAEVLGAHTIFIGANAVDYSGYPDCRPEYMKAFNRLARLAVAEGSSGGRPIRIRAPLMRLTKGEIIRLGLSLGVDYGLTLSCYQPTESGLSCGRCESCLLRLKGFSEAGAADPIGYAVRPEIG
ncbi:MAG: 7-cyano-7-deazaguanine synthase QueC [Deltaproteobacteria bacterium]|nr:7-cyano-7-deazaguanine synthase QueC [Deltaproteobacteria bacterium]